MCEDIRGLRQDLNLTVAYVTRDQEEALAASDHIIVMSNARMARTGTPHEIQEKFIDFRNTYRAGRHFQRGAFLCQGVYSLA